MNILLTDGRKVKISDFGLARTKIVSSSQSKNNAAGSLRWMAPEVIRKQKYSEQSDIYSLGMIIWEISAKCTVPFKNFDDASVIFKTVFSNEKETIPNDIPQNIQGIIKGCWKDNPEERIILTDMLEIKDCSSSQTIHTNHSLEFSNLPKSWSGEEINDSENNPLLSLKTNDFTEQVQAEQTAQILQPSTPPKS